MRTEVRTYSDEAIAIVADLLRAGQVVALPTETVYGLAARADDAAAVQRIFEAKGRPSTNPLIVHVASVDAARELTDDFPADAERLAAALWPGPLTLVLRRRAGVVADQTVAGGQTIAVRVPVSVAMRIVLETVRLPLAAPSANRSMSVSPTTAEHVLKSLDGRIPFVLDAGPCVWGIESTIVDVTRKPAVLLRPGAYSLDVLRRYIDVADPETLVVSPDERAPAPGTFAKHYSPKAKLILVSPAALEAEVKLRRAWGLSLGVLSSSAADLSRFSDATVEILPAEPESYGAGLYAALHRLDDANCREIIVAEPPRTSAWLAVWDRLSRAAASE